MNFGHSELGFMDCPKAKSAPIAEYSMVFRLPAPIASDELLITVFASWATAAHDNDVTSTAAPIHFLSIFASAEYYSGLNPGYPINIAHHFATRAEILPCNILIFSKSGTVSSFRGDRLMELLTVPDFQDHRGQRRRRFTDSDQRRRRRISGGDFQGGCG